MDYLRNIQTFVRCASAGTISSGARGMGISPQAASRQIIALERWLGVRLMHRSKRRLELTEQGRDFHVRCQQALSLIEDGVLALRRPADGCAGKLRLAVTPASIGPTLMAPLLAPLQERYPRLTLELVAQNEPPDFAGQAVDVWLNAGLPPTGGVRTRQIAAVPLVLCAAPAYLERHGTPRAIEELHTHRWVVARPGGPGDRPHAVRLRRSGQPISLTIRVPVAVAMDDEASAQHAVRDGAGIGCFPPFRILPDLRAGRLVTLDVAEVADGLGIYVCVSPFSAHPRRADLVAEFIHEQLARHPDFARGACGRDDCRCRASAAA